MDLFITAKNDVDTRIRSKDFAVPSYGEKASFQDVFASRNDPSRLTTLLAEIQLELSYVAQCHHLV